MEIFSNDFCKINITHQIPWTRLDYRGDRPDRRPSLAWTELTFAMMKRTRNDHLMGLQSRCVLWSAFLTPPPLDIWIGEAENSSQSKNEENTYFHHREQVFCHQTYFFCETVDGKLCWCLKHWVCLWDSDYGIRAAANLDIVSCFKNPQNETYK